MKTKPIKAWQIVWQYPESSNKENGTPFIGTNYEYGYLRIFKTKSVAKEYVDGCVLKSLLKIISVKITPLNNKS